MILTREEILKEIEKGNIKIEPFDISQVQAASVDLHLGNYFRVFKHIRRVIQIRDDIDYADLHTVVTEKIETNGPLILMPQETVLGITKEKITLPPNIAGWLEGRSSFARLGLLIHISASFIQPGISNHQVLEMTNFGPNPLEIYPGTKVCQIIFERTVGSARYEGRFKDQKPENF